MSSDRLTHYRLLPKTLDDLDEIWRYSAETWSLDQADRYIDDLTRTFESLTSMPTIARERSEFNPPVRIHVHGAHLVIYTIAEDHIAILRILGGRQDWRKLLQALD
ncbi:type II toxin-antitoxin system RelE/ParE family toxin [Inquilinus sp. CAU 1745]|uniref:type II toxin-antitoxin system RelE/ParE family toxin n=1 Tax=Inquilinus sp. CAU 1745 TaxID=3140369 RepID=UPI00325BBBB3